MIGNNQKKSVKFSKKAQAAMEFLMTYGWALLVVLLAIGALTYFNKGISNKSSEICVVGAGFGCSEFKINTNAITLVLRNGLGKDISNAVVQITDSSGTSCESSTNLWVDGTSQTFTIPCSISPNKKFNGNIQIVYSVVSGSLSRTNTGKVGGTPSGTTTPPTATCSDSDSGTYPTVNYNVQGTASDGTNTGTDSCSGSVLTEYSCATSSSSISSSSYTCANGCSSGKCDAVAGSPNFMLSNVQGFDFACVYESPPVTFRVTNTGTVAGVPIITYSVPDASGFVLIPTPTSIAPGSYVDYSLNIDYNFEANNQWQATITTSPGETEMSNLFSCQ